MTSALRKPRPRAVWVGTSDHADGLRRIHDPGVAATVWRRRRDLDFAAWIEGVSPYKLPRLRAQMAVTEVEAAVHAACDVTGLVLSQGRQTLALDVAALARVFGAVMATTQVQVRLDVIRTNACHKFHCDRIAARLLCTYRGHGTEYGPAAADGSVPRHDALAPFDAAIFRGTLWPGEDCGLLHRSPTIAGTDETRLLLVVDLPEDEDDCDCGAPHQLS